MTDPTDFTDQRRTKSILLQRFQAQDKALFKVSQQTDEVAVEEPLEIRLLFGPKSARVSRSLSITMRTPGDDFELAVGFLLSEGLIRARQDLDLKWDLDLTTDLSQPVNTSGAVSENVVRVPLAAHVAVNFERLQRHVYTTSSCGLCGKVSLEALEHHGACSVADIPLSLNAAWVAELPTRLRSAQQVFSSTGGLHAAALFAANGSITALKEDVGRHNAVDKVLGRLLLENQLPLHYSVLVVSGRASLELVQKAVAAQVPVMVAIGAPSSLAVECAEHFGLTLIGFASAQRFNCYTRSKRLTNI